MTDPLPDPTTKHAETLAALEASPWCRKVEPPKSAVAIFLSSATGVRRLKRSLRRDV